MKLKCDHEVIVECSTDISTVQCFKKCEKVCERCNNQCRKPCWEDCGPCQLMVSPTFQQKLTKMILSTLKMNFFCILIVPFPGLYQNNDPYSLHLIIFQFEKTIPECGHVVSLECFVLPTREWCNAKCESLLPCGHRCKSMCRKPCNGDECKEIVEIDNYIYPPLCGHKSMYALCHPTDEGT